MSPFGADSWLKTGPGSAGFGTHCAANVSVTEYKEKIRLKDPNTWEH